jgi:hypothetical protein
MAVRDDTDALLAAALAAKALRVAEQADARILTPGPQGERGPQGPAGRDGKDGLAGPAGAPGARGEAGPKGEAGPRGERGSVGPEGPAGPQGEPGASGQTGADGLEGPQGPQGERGLRGYTGADGKDAVPFAPALVTFERDSERRTTRLLMTNATDTRIEIIPVRASDGRISEATVSLMAA